MGLRTDRNSDLPPYHILIYYSILKKEFEKYGYEINDKHMTAEEVKASGNAVAQRQVPMIGKDIRVSNKRSVKELGMKYHTFNETLIDMANSLIKQGIVLDKIQKK